MHSIPETDLENSNNIMKAIQRMGGSSSLCIPYLRKRTQTIVLKGYSKVRKVSFVVHFMPETENSNNIIKAIQR